MANLLPNYPIKLSLLHDGKSEAKDKSRRSQNRSKKATTNKQIDFVWLVEILVCQNNILWEIRICHVKFEIRINFCDSSEDWGIFV